jgi:MtN3 and saliva related transmembrane protein
MAGPAFALLAGRHLPANAGRSVRALTRPEGVLMTDALGVAAAGWGVLMAISPTLQIRRILDRRSSDDISISYLAVLQIGFMLWVGYGIALGNAAIVVPNGVAFVVGLATIAVSLRFRAPTRYPAGES